MITSLILLAVISVDPQTGFAPIQIKIIEQPLEHPVCKPGMPCWKGSQKSATQKKKIKTPKTQPVCKTCRKQKVKYKYDPMKSYNENWRLAEAAGAFDYADVGKETDNP